MTNLVSNVLIDDFEKFDLGFNTVCNAVAKTLGSEGRLALLEPSDGNLPFQYTKDGYNTAKSIHFTDKVVNAGAMQAKTATANTLQRSGDSTTSTLVLAREILGGIKRKNYNKKVEKGIKEAVAEVSSHIKVLSKPVDENFLSQIAITSVNSDRVLGGKIIEAYNKVGVNGIVEVSRDYDSTEVSVVTQKGFKLNAGYASPFYINKDSDATWTAENAIVICLETYQSDETIDDFIKKNRIDSDGNLVPMFIIIEKNGHLTQLIVELVQQNKIDACLVVSPDGHNEKKCITNLQDVALFTNTIPYNPTHNEIKFGFADKIVVDFEKTIIICESVSEEVTTKISELKLQKTDVEFAKMRIQRLEGVSSLISVGGNSPADINEVFDRVDDALRAVKTASKEGWIAGGGSTLLHISERMLQTFENSDIQKGYNLIKKSLGAVQSQIIKNANRGKEMRELAAKTSKEKYGFGYNASKDEISNLIEDGILDSALSIRVALESAVESANKMLLTAVIVHYPKL